MKSTEIIKPAALVAPLAFNGTKNSIPDSATGTNAASVAEGFPAVTSLPKSEGGLPPQEPILMVCFIFQQIRRSICKMVES